MSRVTDAQVIEYYYKSFGIVSRAAKLIEKDFKISFSNEAMHQRVKRLIENGSIVPERCTNDLVDLAEEQLIAILSKGSEKGKINMINLILKTKGSERGWGEKQSKEVRKIEIEIVTDDKEDD